MNVAEAVFQGAEQRMRPMADDGAVGRRRAVSGRGLARHRQSGATAAGTVAF